MHLTYRRLGGGGDRRRTGLPRILLGDDLPSTKYQKLPRDPNPLFQNKIIENVQGYLGQRKES